MNTTSWRLYFEFNQLNRVEPEWTAPCLLSAGLKKKLAASLSHFQLGETGGGTFLLREASKESDADDLTALGHFVREENEHARLLACMVERLDGRIVHGHWTHRLFKFARQAGGFRFEIQMLLTAEIVGTAYYELLEAKIDDAPLRAALQLMLHDEGGHIAFHLDRLRLRWHEYLPFERSLWALQFQAFMLLALRVAWLDHGPCLRALGYTWQDFSRNGRQAAIKFLDELETQISSCARCPTVKSETERISA